MSQTQDHRKRLAIHVAAHAVAEARLGEPFELMAIHEGEPQWLARDDSLDWNNPEQAEQVLVRLAVGPAAHRTHYPHETTEPPLVQHDMARLRDVLRRLEGTEPTERLEERWIERGRQFLEQPANAHAFALIVQDLQLYGWLRMEEIDFIIDAADGDADALDDLARFRKLYDVVPVTWPDET